MIRGIRRRDTFGRLRADGHRVRRHGMAVVYLPGEADATEVAFAISRRAGNAVRRNRCRRRLRSALVDLDRSGRLPPGAYLITVGSSRIDASQQVLRSSFEDVVRSFENGRR